MFLWCNGSTALFHGVDASSILARNTTGGLIHFPPAPMRNRVMVTQWFHKPHISVQIRVPQPARKQTIIACVGLQSGMSVVRYRRERKITSANVALTNHNQTILGGLARHYNGAVIITGCSLVVRRLLWEQEVVGSIPATPTTMLR